MSVTMIQSMDIGMVMPLAVKIVSMVGISQIARNVLLVSRKVFLRGLDTCSRFSHMFEKYLKNVLKVFKSA